MKIFITGATGYVGGSISAKLVALGHEVHGLVRSSEKAAQLKAAGVVPVVGTLAELSLINAAAREADAVINAASSEDSLVAEALIEALAGSDKPLLHTSGSSVIADRADGEASDVIFSEDTPFDSLPERLLRVAVERKVLLAARRKIRSVVIRPTLIYGRGRGLNKNSIQLPRLIAIARKSGIARHVGRGLNIWSHVHIDDVVDFYLLALEKAPPSSLFFVGDGEASWKTMASSVGVALGLGPQTREWPIHDAIREWGASVITSYGSNSRVDSTKARRMLGWQPSGPPLVEEIEQGSYREDFARA